jgi:hypothetical protein
MDYEPDYEDEPTPEEAIPEEPPAEIIVRGFTVSQILDAVANRCAFDKNGKNSIAEQVRAHLQALVKKQVEDLVSETLKDTVRELATVEFKRMLGEGFRKTNSYGEPCGNRITFAERARELLFGNTNDGYRRGLAHEVTEAAIKQLFTPDVNELVAKAKTELKNALDEQVRTKIASAIRDAIGLRT